MFLVLFSCTKEQDIKKIEEVKIPSLKTENIKEDKLAVYYGAADTVVAMAFGKLSEVIQFTKDNSL